MGYKIEIVTKKLSENRNDAFWYYDNKDIAVVQFMSGKKLYVESNGELELSFEIDGDTYEGKKAVEYAIENNLTDSDLEEISEFDGFGLNNWIDVVLVDIHGESSDEPLGTFGSYDEALEKLPEIASQEYDKMYKTT